MVQTTQEKKVKAINWTGRTRAFHKLKGTLTLVAFHLCNNNYKHVVLVLEQATNEGRQTRLCMLPDNFFSEAANEAKWEVFCEMMMRWPDLFSSAGFDDLMLRGRALATAIFGEIKTIEDVKRFFEHLNGAEDLAFHPEDSFSQYYNRTLSHRAYTDAQAALLDAAMDQCEDVCVANGYADASTLACEMFQYEEEEKPTEPTNDFAGAEILRVQEDFMTLAEYLNQENPKRMPTVLLAEGEYIKGAIQGPPTNRTQSVFVHAFSGYEYILKAGSNRLYTNDGDGNPKAMSCFIIPSTDAL